MRSPATFCIALSNFPFVSKYDTASNASPAALMAMPAHCKADEKKPEPALTLQVYMLVIVLLLVLKL